MCIYDVYGPCSCPHGRCFTVLAQCFTISSWVTSLMAITSCYYMYVRPIPLEGEQELPREGFGYISRQTGVLEPPSYRQCVFYTGDEKDEYFSGDGMWRAGKAMSLLACGVGGVVMCIVMCTCCVAYQLPTFDALFWTCMFCFVAQALTFLAWGSDLCDEYECTWSSGTGMNLTAAMLWVWAGNMIKSFPEALPPRGRGRRKPVYQDDGDEPYLNQNRGFADEYEEDDWQNENDDQYYDENDDGYYDDDGNYDDGQYYDDGENYDDGTGSYPTDDYDSQDPNSYSQDSPHDPNYPPPDGYIGNDGYDDQYEQDPAYATDYSEPQPDAQQEYKQGRDDEFEPDPHFQDSWKGEVEDEPYDSSRDSNAFQEDPDSLRNSQQDLSEEELQFLGNGDDQGEQKQESFSGLD